MHEADDERIRQWIALRKQDNEQCGKDERPEDETIPSRQDHAHAVIASFI
jgi:hypothetical protein